MRSLFWRWVFSVVVGSLWGAIVSPGKSPTGEWQVRAPTADAAHYARAMKTRPSTISPAVNAMTF